MTQNQQNRKDVVDNVTTHFENHRALWQDIPPIAESVATLLSTKQEIHLSTLVQADGTSPNTTAKNLALELAADKAYTLGRRICAWARKNGRSDVLGAIDLTESDLRYGAEDERLTRQQLIVQYATEHKTELAAYKVNDAAIDDLQTAINTATALRAGRNDKQNHRIFSTANLEEQLAKAAHQMDILDDEVEGLIDNREFIDTYFIARRKTDRKATRATPAGQPAPGA